MNDLRDLELFPEEGVVGHPLFTAEEWQRFLEEYRAETAPRFRENERMLKQSLHEAQTRGPYISAC
jgi:hypothetical protein